MADSAGSSSEVIQKYEQELLRLEGLIETLKKEQKQLKWYLVAGAVLSPVGFFWSKLWALYIAGMFVTIWAVSLYLNRVHQGERRFNLLRTRRDLEKLRATS